MKGLGVGDVDLEVGEGCDGVGDEVDRQIDRFPI